MTARRQLRDITALAATLIVLFSAAVGIHHLLYPPRSGKKAEAAPESQKRHLRLLKSVNRLPILDEWLAELERLPKWTHYTCWRGHDMDAWECTVVYVHGNPDLWLDVHCYEAEGRCWLSRHK